MRIILTSIGIFLFFCGMYLGTWYLTRSGEALAVSDQVFLSVLKLYKPTVFSAKERGEVAVEDIELDEDEQRVKALLRRIYTNISGFRVDQKEREAVCANGILRELTYGEITFDALQVIFNDLELTHDDVFYDLGSGVGKAVLQAVLATPMRKAVGIELVPTRVALARKVYATMVDEGSMPRNKIVAYRQENMMDTIMDDATVVYLCSTCYSPQLMRSIMDKLVVLPHNKVRVITLKKLPKNNVFTLSKEYRLPTSWSKKAAMYVYVKE